MDPASRFYFCRFSQLSLLRLLTNGSTMGDDVLTQAEAWQVYGIFFRDGRAFFTDEPKGVEGLLRLRTSKDEASTKEWADAYLTSFAEQAGLQFVTFDKALAGKTKGSILLRP